MTDLLQAHSLLVIPSDDLRGVLEDGPCGFRPPVAVTSQFNRTPGAPPDGKWYAATKPGARIPGRMALVLRWEGQDLPHGWLAAELAQDLLLEVRTWPGRRLFLLKDLYEKGCTLIALDKQGKEVDHD